MNIMDDFWSSTLKQIRSEIPEQQFTTWIKPLQAEVRDDGVVLTAPNRFILQWVRDRFLRQIEEKAKQNGIASIRLTQRLEPQQNPAEKPAENPGNQEDPRQASLEKHRLNPNFTFSTFIGGKANQLARAAALQVAENPGAAYNPLFVYGGVGLGKTHLIQAIGNQILERQPLAKVRYVHAEKYVSDVVRAYQHKSFDSFKRYYHSLDLLMIDDIQFFGGKARTQEEFFFAFNALVESHRQVIITCDSFPKEIAGMEERLISRFGWGLTVAIEPPELEMRVAILINKARLEGLSLDEDVAFFIAKHIRSNVRELEGALKRVQAYSRFKGDAITLQSTREALKDLLALQHRQISIENIQKTVADYYKIKVGDMFSKKRTRALARPRQMAMALAKDITNLSLPDIGDAFGGRDHTTVLHACRKMQELCETDNTIQRDFLALQQILNG
ncbi:MAG: chromosomal replication initiator protein DnaA [Betaproteobacteria bacterium]|nr:chromosomal replication initiator protein DnaA [Betaproteobacteria bacterium]MDE2622702.1 chromosomal replication initiator protein DnaA [Betaproteobacteria bacterium]